MRRLFTPTTVIIFARLVFGVLAALMMKWGNPANMGICVACFFRDIAGGLGPSLRRISSQGRFFSAGSFFIMGAFLMLGALVFLGYPVRALLRLAGGFLSGGR